MDVSLILHEMGQKARRAAAELALATSEAKDAALRAMASELRAHKAEILEANRLDVTEAEAEGLNKAMVQRLTLDDKQIEGMAKGIEEVAALPDPIGRGVSSHISPEGLEISQVRVPLGVIGVIYESRPNVTADTASLCLKSGNAVILRGGSEAVNSNRIIAKILNEAALAEGMPDGCIQLLDFNGREFTTALMELEDLDVLVPRGGTGLKAAVKAHCKVPYIMTGDGVCHIYFAPSADSEMCMQCRRDAAVPRGLRAGAASGCLHCSGSARRRASRRQESLRADRDEAGYGR